MKTPTLALVILATVVAGFMAYFGGRALHDPAQPADARDEIQWMKKELALSDADFAKVETLHLAYVPRCDELCMAVAESGRKVRELASATPVMTEAVAAAITEDERVRAECRIALLAHLYETAAAMPSKASQRFLEMALPSVLRPAIPMSTIAFAIDRPVMDAHALIPFPSDPDDAAMLRLAAGDDHALDEIIARWSARLISFLLRLTGNHATACDLAQEAFVRLYRSRERYRSGGSFSGLLVQIASNLAKNHTRWKSRHPETPLDDDTFPEPAAKAYATPDREAEANETAEAVRDAVLALPDDLRTPLVLSVYEQKPQDEIAAILGCSRKAVETRIYRARQILRERLSKYFSEG